MRRQARWARHHTPPMLEASWSPEHRWSSLQTSHILTLTGMNNCCAHACVFVLTEQLWAYELMALRTYRCGERIVHIPFFSPSRESTSQELREWEQELKQGRLENSACIGHLIAREWADQCCTTAAYQLRDTALCSESPSWPSLPSSQLLCTASCHGWNGMLLIW